MSNPNCLKFSCQYKYNDNYQCQMRYNGCMVRSLGSMVTSEDKENIHVVLKYSAVKQLTDGGSKKLMAVLECNGFDIEKEFDMYNHKDDKQVEYVQQREWED